MSVERVVAAIRAQARPEAPIPGSPEAVLQDVLRFGVVDLRAAAQAGSWDQVNAVSERMATMLRDRVERTVHVLLDGGGEQTWTVDVAEQMVRKAEDWRWVNGASDGHRLVVRIEGRVARLAVKPPKEDQP